MKKNTEWEVLTPLGWKDFDGVSKTEVPMDRVVVVELVDGTSLTCSAGHQVTLKRYDEVSHVFVELIEPEYGEDAILTKNGFVKVKSVTKHVEEKTVDMYDLVNVDGGYEYYTNDIVSHNCAHIDDMAEIWVGIQPTLSCVAGDTLVLTDNGFQRIESFHQGKQVGDYFDLEIPIYGKNGMEKTSKGYVSPDNETIIVQTNHGHKVEVTPIHPLYTVRNNEEQMVQAQFLETGDLLRISYGMNCFGNTSLGEQIAFDLGVESIINNAKHVPQDILSGTEEDAKSFIDGIFEYSGTTKIVNVINETFAIELQLIINNFGYKTSVTKTTEGTFDLYYDDSVDRSLTHQFYWDKVHSLTKSYNKTYDFTVPETHTFLQNGILGSNTGGQAILISCVTKDTMVYTSEGIKTLEHFSKQTNGKQGAHILNEYTVQGIDKTRNGTLFFDGGNVPTKIIKTSFSEIECSHEHKFWAWSQEKGFAIHKAHEITKHDTWLAIRKNMNIWNKTGHIINDYPNSKPDGRPEKNIYPDTNSISLQMAYFLGLYYAEGSIYKSQDKNGKHIGSNVHICCGDTEAKEELEKLGLHVSTTGIQHTISSKSLVRFMEYLGVDPSQKADSKVLPDRLMSLPVEHTVALLQGLFDGDGYSRIDRGEVGYTSISEKLVDQIRILLCNLGILTYKTKRTKEEVNQSIATDKQFKHDSYILSCSAIYSNIFFEKIGFRFKRKQQKNTALFTRNLTRMSSKDLFPPGYVEHAKKVVRTTSNNKTMNKDRVAIQSLYGTNVQWLRAGEYKTPSVSRESMLIVNKYLEQNCQTRLFDKQVLDDDIVWAPVKSIEESHGHVYDFSLPNNKADGDFAHSVIYNSGISGFQSPNGVGNTFHRIWVDAIEEKNDFVAVELPWTVHPERDQAWYEKESNNIRAGNGERGVQQEFHCVPGETKVVTLDGCKNIKDISVGDKVLTHQGRFRKVYATHKHSYDPTSESLYTVSAPGNRRQSLLITGNHPVLNYKFKLRKHQSAKEMLLANKASFDGFDVLDLWKHEGVNHTRKIIYNALFPQCSIGSLLEENKEHILLSDFCTGANLQVSEEGHCRVHRQNKNKTSPIENQQTLSFDFGRFVGLFAAEGFSAEKNFGFAFHLDEKDTLVSFVESFLKNFGACYYTKIRDYSKCITVCSTNKIMKSVLEQFVKQESGATTKHYNMDALLKTNPEFIRGVVVGHFEGDGDHPKNGLNRKLKVSCYSPKMLYQLKVLLSCYGLFGRIGNWYDSIAYYELDGLDNLEQQNRNIDFLTRQSNTHKLLEKPNSRTVLFEQERQFVGKVQFSKASQELQAGMKSEALELYNISVEEDESYIADSIVVHNCSFNASGDTFVKSEILGIIEENCSEPIAKHNKWPELWIWKHPEPGHNYLISADVSRGNSADFSACQVFNTTTDEIVAEYKGKIYPDKFAELLIEVGTRYNTALICPELNTYGAHTATELKKANYGNLYYEKMHKNIYMAFSNIEVSDDELPGWTSGPKSRDEIIAKLEAVLRKQTIRLPSKRLVNELKTFIWKNNKAQAMKGYNDDLVMALAIGVNLYETSGRPQYSHEEIAKGMLAGMSTRGSQMNAGLSDWGVTEVQGSPVPGQVAKNNPWLKVQKPNPFQKNPKSVQNHNDPFWRQWGWLND